MRITALKGAVGTGSSTLAVWFSWNANNVEIGLRITSLIVGIAVGVVTIWSIVRKWDQK